MIPNVALIWISQPSRKTGSPWEVWMLALTFRKFSSNCMQEFESGFDIALVALEMRKGLGRSEKGTMKNLGTDVDPQPAYNIMKLVREAIL
ncbi:hypothetical protein N7478_003715 [Penicillium angulare]|uniref:uncharacterized protein n=1 Tax=Penicillium angulare TaxID=116970 RepID=UPI002540538B|nr:uncharacterized protein N7478_003715 [Penicillium angulare]KAJ5288029.1 hypothetical protein N7478_003715 [Penicillium angulare]